MSALPEELADLPTPPPGKYYLPHTQRAVRDIMSLVGKKKYAQSQIDNYKTKIEQLQLQIQILEKRKTYYDEDIITLKQKAKRYLEDDVERYESSKE